MVVVGLFGFFFVSDPFPFRKAGFVWMANDLFEAEATGNCQHY